MAYTATTPPREQPAPRHLAHEVGAAVGVGNHLPVGHKVDLARDRNGTACPPGKLHGGVLGGPDLVGGVDAARIAGAPEVPLSPHRLAKAIISEALPRMTPGLQSLQPGPKSRCARRRCRCPRGRARRSCPHLHGLRRGGDGLGVNGQQRPGVQIDGVSGGGAETRPRRADRPWPQSRPRQAARWPAS